ncbi:MAG: redoxin domain-containing protein [Verrucomicrobiales bacterium]|nr:redoxin domain-containing protein [Verrucomicrobiales bacterium]
MRDNMSSLKKRGIKVIGVSMDKAEDQKKFKDKNDYKFPLIADTEGVLVKAFGVKLFTPKICARESFLIQGGKIVWIDRKVSPKTHTEKVIAAADSLTKKK